MDVQEKLEHYEAIFEQIKKEGVNKPAVVTSEEFEGRYRVSAGGDDLIAFSSVKEKLEIGTQVIVVNNIITQVLPDNLKLKEESTSTDDFKLVSWDDIGGIESQVKRIRETVELPIKYDKLYKEFNLEPSKGLALYGAAGCGKTMIAKAIASTIIKKNAKDFSKLFIYMKGGEVLSPYVGQAEAKIKAIFDSCRKVHKETGQRPVLFIDEAEAILNTRGSGISQDVNRTIVPTFLAEMDGLDGFNPFVILSTNLLDTIDPAILRAGRIDLKLHITRPNESDAVSIFKIYLGKTKVEGNIDEMSREASKLMYTQNSLVKEASGALISNVVSQAVTIAIKRRIANDKDKRGLTMEDLSEAIINY